MKNCPSVELWRDFLDDSLTKTDEADLSGHLESCPHCLQALDRLTSAPTDPELNMDLTPTPACVELQRLKPLLPATLATPVTALPNGLPTVPGYDIESELGRGGMGIVYRARHTQLNRRVALKMITAGPNATQEQIIRFLAEAQTCAGLAHPNIVQIFEVSQHAGMPYYSMEYVEGGTLADRVHRQPFTPREAAALVELLARAMHVAHGHGIIHRDLKPANVLLACGGVGNGESSSRTNGRPHSATHNSLLTSLQPKITDFGLAKRLDRDDGLTQTGAPLGTPDYMAPEQVESGTTSVGPGVDIYALGAILYYLFAGRAPFTAATALQTLANVLQADPVAPSQLNPAVPHDLSIICLHCLEKEPARRYASAEALADDLRRFLNGEPITARPATEFQRVWKWAKRRPAIACLSGLLVTVVFVSLGLVSWQWYLADQAYGREADRANKEAKAKENEAEARRAAQLLSAGYALDQGIQECRAGRIEAGLLSMVRALELLPPNEPDLEFSIRTNIGAWRERLWPAQRGPGHGTAVVSVAASPDGKTALVGNWGNRMGNIGPAQVQLWHVDRWTEAPIWSQGYDEDTPARVMGTGPAFVAAWSVAFDPSGSRVAVGGLNGLTCVRAAKTGELCLPPLPHSGPVFSVAFSPDGKTLAVGGSANDPKQIQISGGGELRFWDAATGRPLGEPHPFPFRIQSLAWCPDGRSIALGGVDPDKTDTGMAGVAALFDFEQREIRRPLMLHGDTVRSVAVHPEGKLLATGCGDGLVRFWNLPDCTLVEKRLLRHADAVNCVQFSKSGAWLATAWGHHAPGVRSGTGGIGVWDVASGALLLAPIFEPIAGFSQKMHSVAFVDDDRKLVAACEHGRAWLWTLPPPLAPRCTFALKDAADITHSTDGRTMALTVLPPRQRGFNRMPCEVHLIDTVSGRTNGVFHYPVCVWVRFSRDSKRVLIFPRGVDLGPDVCLYDAATGQRLSVPASFASCPRDAWFADEATLVTIAANGDLRRWHAADLTPLGEPTPCLAPTELIVAVNTSCTRLLASGPGGARLVALPEGRTIATLHPEAIDHGCFASADATVVTVRGKTTPSVALWSADDGSPKTAPVNAQDRYVRSADGRCLIDLVKGGSSDKGNIEIPGHGEFAIHRTTKFLVSTEGGNSKHVQLWSANGKTIGPPLPHPFLHAVEFNPNGDWLVTSGNDKTTKIWPLPRPAEGTPASLRAAVQRGGAPD